MEEKAGGVEGETGGAAAWGEGHLSSEDGQREASTGGGEKVTSPGGEKVDGAWTGAEAEGVQQEGVQQEGVPQAATRRSSTESM